MKNFLFIFCELALTGDALAQAIFPMHNGDVWQYICNSPDQPSPQCGITADSTLANGITYKVRYGGLLPSQFLRHYGEKIIAYNASDSSEFNLYDFSANLNDTISFRNQYSQRFAIVLLDTGTVDASLPQWSVFAGARYWVFADRIVVGNSGYEFSREIVIDSVGLVEVWGEPGYHWLLTGARIDGVVRFGTVNSVQRSSNSIPDQIALNQNYPNPFNPSTTISFDIPSKQHISLRIYNLLGSQIAVLIDAELVPGHYSAFWDGAKMSSGVYFCQLQTAVRLLTRKLMLLK